MNLGKKMGRFLCSMKFGLILLGIMIIACVAGSVISQGQSQSFYTSLYTEKGAWIIILLGLDDVFHSPWFAALTIMVCVNLLGCNLLRFPKLFGVMNGYTAENFSRKNPEETGRITADPEELFHAMGFQKVLTREGGDRYGVRNRIGCWGAWLTHLGMLVIIVGFALGQIYTVKYTVYGVTGQTKSVGDTGYELTIDSFEIGLREDETVKQYTSQITVTNTATGESKSGEASVNHPLGLFGMKYYQNSTGWAATVQVVQDQEVLQEGLICAGEYTQLLEIEGLYLVFNAFYPDYVKDASGQPATASSAMNNPAYLYTLYYDGRVLGMDVLMDGDEITLNDYEIILKAPQQYTLIQAKRDPFTWLAGIGAVIILLALLISFYVRTEELYARKQEDGSWSIMGDSRKGGVLYQEKLLECIDHINGKVN